MRDYLLKLSIVNYFIKIVLILKIFIIPVFAEFQDNAGKAKIEFDELYQKTVQAYQQNKYKEGIQWAQKAFEFAKTNFGDKSPPTLIAMGYLAELYKSQGSYEEAEPLLKKSLQLCVNVFGKKHQNTISLINNLANLYESQGRYREAEPLYKKALHLSENVLGKKHPNTIKIKNNLAALYRSQGRYAEAETLLKKALELSENVLGKKHSNTITFINNLGELYRLQGRYGEAEPLFKKALQLSENVLGKKHPNTITSISSLAVLYEMQGRYGEAEPLFKKALQLNENILRKNHPNTITSINNLAGLYESQGRYGEAEPLFKKALQFRKNILGKQHPDTIASMNNLAGLYKSQGRYREAEPLYKKALLLSKNILDKKHPNTIVSINNLAALYVSQGRYGEAEPLYKKALQLHESVLGKHHPNSIAFINNLGDLYESQGRYGEAESMFRKALQLHETVLGKHHPNSIFSINNLIALYAESDKIIKCNKQKGFRLLKQLESCLLSRSAQELISTQTEKVRRIYLKNISNFYDLAYSFVNKYPDNESIRFASNMMLRGKQIQAEESAFQHRLLRLSKDPAIMTLKKMITDLRSKLSKSIRNTKDSQKVNQILQSLLDAEAGLRQKAREFNPSLQTVPYNIDQIMGVLPENSGLIEFKVYNKTIDFNTKKGEYHLAAYLIFSNMEANQAVFFEDVGNFKDINNAWINWQISGKTREISKKLYQLLFGKFDKYIKHLNCLYIAPDHFLNLIPFASLILDDGKYFAQHLQINRLQTGRDLIRKETSKPDPVLIAMGGIQYDQSKSITVKNSNANPNKRAADELEDGMKYLKYSLEEADIIQSMYEIYHPEGKAYFYHGPDATEKSLKSIKKAPQILHLSTHGFFLGQKEYKKPEQQKALEKMENEAPLMLSGLALANANLGKYGIVDNDGEDGLMYSIEVLGLNLQGTHLVSLSACNTGKGVVDYSEGLYGLVRAFRTAGAKSVLMTLKSVKDKDAKEFMVKFYDIYLSSDNTITPALALHKTRLAFIAHENSHYNNPEFWSPYVIIGR